MLSTLWQDVRYGARMLLKNPGITIIVIIALALGIGANTAIFSVVNTVLLRPLPYHESERLVFLNEKSPVLDEMSISYPNFTDWRNHNQSFEKMGVYNRSSYNLKKYADDEQQASFYNRLLENIRALPGVESAAAASGLPLGNNGWQTSFAIDGQPPPERDRVPLMEACLVTPDYFRAMNIPVLRGRVFTDRDDRSHLAGRDLSKLNENQRAIAGITSIVIDEEFAKRHWPNEDPVGKRVKLGTANDAPKLEVIGVVGRVKMESLNQNSDRVQGYFAFHQNPSNNMTVIIKGASDPNQLISSVRTAVKAIDPDQPIYNPRTMDEIRAESVQGERLNLTLLSLFAGIALVLAIVGIYGVMSYSVTQRTHEIGIRMAVGARPGDVFKMILGQGMKLALIGVGVGLIGAFLLTRLMETMLFGVQPTDMTTFASISMLLITVALLACYLPGRRATKVEPTVSLRYE